MLVRESTDQTQNGERLSDLFMDTGVVERPKVEIYKNLDLESPFHGQMVDVGCSNLGAALITDVLTQYVDRLQTIGGRDFDQAGLKMS